MSRRVARALAMVLAAGLALSAGNAALAASAAKLKQFKVPTVGSSPANITRTSDGNFWFTESFVNDQGVNQHNVGRITPAGEVTEFPVCEFCFPTDIVQGSDGILYYTKNDATLGRVTTSGQTLPDIPGVFSANGTGVDVQGDDIWVSDLNHAFLRRYDVQTQQFTEFPTPANTSDVAVAPDGMVWFTQNSVSNAIARLDPSTGEVHEIPVTVQARYISIASDGSVWFTAFFDVVGRIDPSTETVSMFPVGGGPDHLAAAAEGSMWVTRFNAGDIVRLSSTGEITAQSKALKGSGPAGITVAPSGNPWFTMQDADKIATLQLQ